MKTTVNALLLAALTCVGCSLGLDTDECGSDQDCPTDRPRVCQDHLCVLSGGQQDSAPIDAAEDAGPTPDKAFGELCEADGECTSGMCREDRCTRACDEGTACPEPSTCDEYCVFPYAKPLSGPPKVAYVYVGPVGDHGWSKTHDDGRLYLESQLPGIVTTFEPSVTPSGAPDVINRFVDEGYNVIIGTSHDFVNAVQNASLNNPDVNFLICSGFVTGPNMGSYFGRMYQVKYLAGRLAGQMTETNRIAYIGPVTIPETVRHINAFTQGVRSVNPDAEVMVSWIGAWFDVEKEETTTNDMIAKGADVIISATDTPIPVITAKDKETPDGHPVFSIGYDNPDTCELFAPDNCMASAYYNWGPVMARQINDMVAGTWNPRDVIWDRISGDPNRSIVYLSPMNTDVVPAQVQLEVESHIQPLANGTEDPFGGPVTDNQGVVRGDGQPLDDRTLLNMCWFVDGVMEPGAIGAELAPAVVPTTCQGDP